MSQDLAHAVLQAAFTRTINVLRIALPDDAWRDVMLLLQVPEERWVADTKVISDILATGPSFGSPKRVDRNAMKVSSSWPKQHRLLAP
jgi:hypothetical protein